VQTMESTVFWFITPCSLEKAFSELHGIITQKTVLFIPKGIIVTCAWRDRKIKPATQKNLNRVLPDYKSGALPLHRSAQIFKCINLILRLYAYTELILLLFGRS
jgi:hypothetical protein